MDQPIPRGHLNQRRGGAAARPAARTRLQPEERRVLDLSFTAQADMEDMGDRAPAVGLRGRDPSTQQQYAPAARPEYGKASAQAHEQASQMALAAAPGTGIDAGRQVAGSDRRRGRGRD